MTEFKFPKGDQWQLVAVKREWVPEWLYRLYSYLPPWLEPFRTIFNKRVDE
jgi:hypothetical protein